MKHELPTDVFADNVAALQAAQARSTAQTLHMEQPLADTLPDPGVTQELPQLEPTRELNAHGETPAPDEDSIHRLHEIGPEAIAALRKAAEVRRALKHGEPATPGSRLKVET